MRGANGGGVMEERLAGLLDRIKANRRSVAVLLGVIWTGVMYLFLRDITISVICGVAFAAVLAATLPRPSDS
ncbi:hypothetical protein [Streptomyces sp. NBC_00696]|uniref:hypothetical protein n=1 Tax=Streptomyces sp. NBC_00696 TaxID=2903672 RepID=UPI002E333608|nr:hypothetical protein [Streptomyces sp. NBC_00696]